MAASDKTYDIFISYAREDSRFVDRLVQQLNRRGYTVFVDREEVRGGEAWRARIVHALTGSRALVIVLSRHFAASNMVTKEMALAREAGVRFLPVLKESVTLPPNKIFYLNGINYLDFTRSFEEGIKDLLAVLPPPHDSWKVWEGKARGAGKAALFSMAGVVGLVVLVLLCYGAYMVGSYIINLPTPTFLPPQTVPLVNTTPFPTPTYGVQAVPADVQRGVIGFVQDAAIAEIQAYAYQDASLASGVYSSDILQGLQQTIGSLSAQGLVLEMQLHSESSRVQAMGFLDSNTVQVETCEVWSGNVRETISRQVVEVIPQKIVAKQLTLVLTPTGWLVTGILLPEPPNFCSES